MPPRPAGGGGPLSEEQMAQLLTQMAQSSERLTTAVASLADSQTSFMRSAADADVNIGLSKSHPYILTELPVVHKIDNSVDNSNRSGLPQSARDTRPPIPDDYVSDAKAKGYDPTFPIHMYGAGHTDTSVEQRDAIVAYHRDRGRTIRMLEKQLPADGYMNTFTEPADKIDQWQATS